jgi:hypothetical protein
MEGFFRAAAISASPDRRRRHARSETYRPLAARKPRNDLLRPMALVFAIAGESGF